MTDFFAPLVQFVVSVLGLVALPDVTALGIAVAVLAVTVLVAAVAVGAVDLQDASSPHPIRAIDPSVLLSQSDPGAAGHPRPRAPGVARAV